jgi:putative transposase
MIDKDYEKLSISEQCNLLEVNRSTYYYVPVKENSETLELMNKIDELYTARPTLGSRGIRDQLNIQGITVNRKKIQRLMEKMGLRTIFPKKNLSKANHQHKKYPYLLKNLKITRPNQVFCADITYIRLRKGFIYLVAIMDWYSRKILSWKVSNTLDADFCVDALEEALIKFGKPEIFNTDQGCQFTSNLFTDLLIENGVQISMDGRGRALDNVFIERFWWSLKHEEVYLKAYETVKEAIFSIGEYIYYYNNQRSHSSLGRRTPSEFYLSELLSCVKVSTENQVMTKQELCLKSS